MCVCVCVCFFEVWALDQRSFREFVVTAQEKKWRQFNECIGKCDLFKALTDHERLKLSEVCDVFFPCHSYILLS